MVLFISNFKTTKPHMKQLYLFLFCFYFSIHSIVAQHFPGGVTDAEVWYIADWEDMSSEIFQNSALTDIQLKNCGTVKKDLFNFNPSIYSDKLCLKYNAPLENTTGRDVFFVGEPYKNKAILSHLGTLWRPNLTTETEADSLQRNFFDLNNKNAYSREIFDEFSSDKNANVNFYHTNHYNIDKKFKSYGQLGETEFYIGAKVNYDPDQNFIDNSFWGRFPEFVSFTRELSSNEKNRVESYLALKYGLTLNKKSSYLSSKNIVFWDKSNNEKFPVEIFGFGKDNISSLNQLQSESTHLKKHLVAAIEKIADNNITKQQTVNILDEHFLVFGNNGGKPVLTQENSKKIKFWEKVWLAQRTGKKVENYPIYFRLTLTDEIIEYLNENPTERLWLLKDNHVSNNEISDFESEHVEYHPGNVNLSTGIGDFSKVFFDTDVNIYDQYTFGVGPKMIVQAQVNGCKGEKLKIRIDITGGKPPYTIVVESSAGGFEVTTNNSFYVFDAVSGIEYTITVIDANGLEFEMTITPEPWNFELELGPNQTLTPANPEIVLDAGAGINDPDATYQWFKDGVLLANTSSTLTVTEAGDYKVIVTSGDQACTISDAIRIYNNGLEAEVSVVNGCGNEYNSIVINIEDGVPTYITSLEGVNGTVNYAHSGSTVLEDISYGSYTLTITDSQGVTHVEDIYIAPPVDFDIYGQLEDICGDDYNSYCINYNYSWDDISEPFFNYNSFYMGSFVLDASNGLFNPNVTYEWWENGELIGTNSVMTFTEGNFECYEQPSNPNSAGGNPIYTAIATDSYTGCVYEQTFITKGICADGDSNTPLVQNNDNEDFVSNADETERLNTSETTQVEELKSDISKLVTRVFPNPSQVSVTFTYEVKSSEILDGTIEIFTLDGAKIRSINIAGQSNYTVPLQLDMSGMYLIKVTSTSGQSKTDRIIIK